MGSAEFSAAAGQYEAAGMVEQAMAMKTYAALTSDYALDCSQSTIGFTPIIGVDWNLGKLNLGAKYEFRTKVEYENDSKNSANVDAAFANFADGAKVRNDIPAILSLGAQYHLLPSLRLSAGYVHYFDTDAEGSATEVSDNTWEASFGAEYDINSKWLVSAGVRHTNYGFAEEGKLSTDGGAGNINAGANGLYWCQVNTTELTYSLYLAETLGVIGDATPGAWDNSTALTPSADFLVWTGDVEFKAGGEWKLRANNAWDVNLGGDMNNLSKDGSNIATPGEGVYTVTLDLSKLPYTVSVAKK
jgi:long-subunit fatty acid transport protein